MCRSDTKPNFEVEKIFNRVRSPTRVAEYMSDPNGRSSALHSTLMSPDDTQGAPTMSQPAAAYAPPHMPLRSHSPQYGGPIPARMPSYAAPGVTPMNVAFPYLNAPIYTHSPHYTPAPPPQPYVALGPPPPAAAGALAPTPPKVRKGSASRTTANPRRRAMTACDTCRYKKIKCDNVRPTCGSCARAGGEPCHYKIDHQAREHMAYDPASTTILAKLDSVLTDLEELKRAVPPRDAAPSRRASPPPDGRADDAVAWDMSLTSVLQWACTKRYMGVIDDYVAGAVSQLVCGYSSPAVDPAGAPAVPLAQQMQTYAAVEALVQDNVRCLVHSYLLNVHPKLPVVDTIEVMVCVEFLEHTRRVAPHVTLVSLVETAAAPPPEPEGFFARVRPLCIEYIPVLLLVCALGALATAVDSANLHRYSSSTEERSTLDAGCLCTVDTASYGPHLPQSRFELSRSMQRYAALLRSQFGRLGRTATRNIQYHLLVNQWCLYASQPLVAYASLVSACHGHMINLMAQATRPPESASDRQRQLVDRIFWACLKLESEMRTELSPYVPSTGITRFAAPSSFPRVPHSDIESLLNDEEFRHLHSASAIKEAAVYDDHNSWYFFLTEIAIRKIDNKMYDELYSQQSVANGEWDTAAFAHERVWLLFIKYFEQYNSVINFLNPRIRNFVMRECDVESVYAKIKSARQRAHSSANGACDIPADDVGDDVLKTQSESIVFIKIRIIASKLYLVRPIVYLLLNNKINMVEFAEAICLVVEDKTPRGGSTSSDDDVSNCTPDSGTFYGTAHQGHFTDEDFSVLAGADPPSGELKRPGVAPARVRVLKSVIENFIAIPKMNIAQLGYHRHAGHWYYLRNAFLSHVFGFLLFKKAEEMSSAALLSEELRVHLSHRVPPTTPEELVGRIKAVFTKDRVRQGLDHMLVILKYWEDESADCKVYQDFLRRCIRAL
ncbi:Zn(2)-C6 fungal-type domain-containing protein [[Candida] zeylanoides]